MALASNARLLGAFSMHMHTGDDDAFTTECTEILPRPAEKQPPSSSEGELEAPPAAPSPAPTDDQSAATLLTVARDQWLPLYRYIQEEQRSSDPRAALSRIEARMRRELGRLVFAAESLRLSSSNGSDDGDDEPSQDDQLDRDVESMPLQDLCRKYGGQGA
jgi:hypothetical protein